MSQQAYDLFTYPQAPGFQRTDTSRAAAEDIAICARTLRAKALLAIREAGFEGLTTNELSAVLNISRDSIQPRTSELRAQGKIVDSGLRRQNANGKSAIVWRAR